jgi:hypothetical protein
VCVHWDECLAPRGFVGVTIGGSKINARICTHNVFSAFPPAPESVGSQKNG